MFPKASDSSKLAFRILNLNQDYSGSQEEVLSKRLHLLKFLAIPLNFSFCLCLSPFYLKVSRATEISIPNTTISTKSRFPQKVLCGVLTILDLLWMIQFVRLSFPKDPKNPAHHIDFVITVISQVYKCLMFKKLWMNQNDFVKIGNFILTSGIPLFQTRWLSKGGNVLICALLLLYIAIGLMYIKWDGGLNDFYIREGVLVAERPRWWSAMIASGKYNLFLANSPSPTSATDLPAWVDNFIGLITTAGLLHRLPIYCLNNSVSFFLVIGYVANTTKQSLQTHFWNLLRRVHTDGNLHIVDTS